ncbi:energy-coupling factor transporter transmembrane component T family protein [Halobacillus naozhouensis]|uniref:Energy-coupling factor transporter transmembrane component T n=1 Tax=Halobacillus naozhouensis TaxID=554880 RepID=A0ABY8IYK6_9BACI|nr:energy-coupling factor transporter transmembrane component T [Halobacillus naozhouensis]WFT74274.1 energy-coupling factor transporter transmembrane component T [Halobacillus naozhouensis]
MNSLYIPKDSLIHSLDPRTKMIFVVFVVISSFILNDPALQLLFLAALFPLVVISKLVTPYLISIQFLLLFAVLIMTVHGIYNPIGETPVFEIFGGLTFKYESMVYAAVMSFRILVIGTAAVLFVMTTHPSDMASALVKWKVPHSFAFILLSTFQIIPIIAREAKIVMEAQQARCLDAKGSIIQRVKNLVPIFAPLFIITFMKVHQLSYVLECRAFSREGTKTSLRDTKIGSKDYFFLLGILIVLAFEVYVRMFMIESLNLTTDALLTYSLIGTWILFGFMIAKFLFKRIQVYMGGLADARS